MNELAVDMASITYVFYVQLNKLCNRWLSQVHKF